MVRRINEEMRKQGLVQETLAEKAGVSQSTVNRLLNEDVDPLFGNVVKIAKALDVPVEYLTTESDVKALLYLRIKNTSDEEVNNILFQVRRDQYFREHGEATQEKSPHIPLSAPNLKS